MPYIRQSGAWVDVLNTAPSGGSPSDLHPSGLLADDVVSASSSRALVTAVASATPHSVSGATWQVVTSSLSGDADGVVVTLGASTAVSGADSSTLLEIGTGGSGSETVWATIAVGYTATGRVITVPGHLAAGTRVVVRSRSVTASKSVSVYVSFTAAKTTTLGAPVTYGVDTSTSRGTALTAPGSTNTKGAWLSLVAATTDALAALLITMQANGTIGMATGGVLIDIGIDTTGGTTYTTIIPDLYFLGSSTESYTALVPQTYGVDIPAGSRIGARYARSSASNAVDLILTGAKAA